MKKLCIAVLIGASVSCALADPTLYWGSDNAFGGSGAVAYTNGALIVKNSDWLVELINTADDTVLYSTTSGFLAGDGIFFDTPDATAWNGLSVRTVIYDANKKENAGMFAVFGNPLSATQLQWSTSPAPPATYNYNASDVQSTSWEAIPEPAVAGLIGIFGGGLIFARRMFTKGA